MHKCKCKLTDVRRRLCSKQMFLKICKLWTNFRADCDTLWRCLCDYANRFRRLHNISWLCHKLSVENRTVGLEWRLVLCDGWGGYVLCVCAGWTVHLYYFFPQPSKSVTIVLCVCVCVCVCQSVAISGDVKVCSFVANWDLLHACTLVSLILCACSLSSHHTTQTVFLHLSFWLASSN